MTRRTLPMPPMFPRTVGGMTTDELETAFESGSSKESNDAAREAFRRLRDGKLPLQLLARARCLLSELALWRLPPDVADQVERALEATEPTYAAIKNGPPITENAFGALIPEIAKRLEGGDS